MTMSLRAALYTRISQKDESFDKVEVQENNLRQLASANDYEVVRVYCDDGISAFRKGDKSKTRSDWERLLLDIARGEYDVVLAVAPDRFTRDTEDGAAFRHLCAKHNVVVHTKSVGKVDLSDPLSRALSGVMDVFSELDVAVRQAKLRDRFDEETAKGNPLWGTRPFGYSKDRLTLNESEAEELRWAYKIILEGGTIYSIIKSWNERDIRTSTGRTWSYATVQGMLKRPRNAGIVMRNDVEQVGVVANWVPVVTREEFDAVKAILSDPKRRTPHGRKPKHLMSSIVRCGVCGSVMRSASVKHKEIQVPIYKCALKMTAQGFGERHPTIQADILDPMIREAVVAAFTFGPANMIDDDSEESVAPLQAELSSIRAQRDKLLDLVVLKVVDDADIVRQLKELKQREHSLDDDVKRIVQARARASMAVDLRKDLFQEDHRVNVEDVVQLKFALRDRWDSLSLERKKELVRNLLEVTVYPGRNPKARVKIRHKVVESLNPEALDEPAYP